MTTNNQGNALKALPIFLAFLCMGFGDAVGPFVGLAKEEFNLDLTVAGLIPFAGFIMFGLLSIPMGIYQDRKGKKYVLNLGLIIAFIGLIIPVVFPLTSFGIFIITVLLLGTGAATLQVAGNPIMRDVSPEGKYARNLTFGQFVKAIGSLSGAVIPPIAVAYFGMDWKILFPIYTSIILITIILITLTKILPKTQEKQEPASFKSCLKLLTDKYVWKMVLGIFLYVGAEVSVSQGVPLFLKEQFGISIAEKGLLGTGLFFTALVIGRFSGGVILNWIKARTFLKITSILSVVGIICVFTGLQTISIIGFFVIGLGFANIFPLIFSMAIDKMPERANELSGLMVTAIAGGAIIPFIMNIVSQLSGSVLIGFSIPLLCILYIFTLSIKK